MSLTKTFDEHTICIKVPAVVTSEQVKTAIAKAFTQALELDKDYKTTFHINMVKKKGVQTGRGFVWIQNPKVYHMILGRNPDGSERVTQVNDPNWQQPTEKKVVTSTRWADMDDDEEEAPLIDLKQEPLITVPKIMMSDEQFKEHLKQEGLVDPKQEITIHIDAAQAHDVEIGFCHNVLHSSALHPGMDEKFIFDQFKDFSTSTKTYPIRIGHGREGVKYVPYPYVKIVEINKPRGRERVAYVTFDSSTRDASFAFHMRRCCEYKRVVNDKPEVFTVNYTYAKSSNK